MRIEDLRSVHFVGIGGIGTSGVARILLAKGKEVSGSDVEETPLLGELKRLGATIFLGHRPENISDRVQAVVASAAIPPDNPELITARKRTLPVLTYSQALGSLMERRFGVAIAGTHGKTTTSAMIASILKQAGYDPGFVIGGEVPSLGGNSGAGKGDFLVAEACEYRRNFLALRPRTVLVTNIEEDHLDYYRDITEIEEAFLEFLTLLPPDGFAVLCREDKRVMKVASHLNRRFFTYGFSESDYQAKKIKLDLKTTSFEVYFVGRPIAEVSLKIPGQHNVLNSLGAFALCHRLGIEAKKVAESLRVFPGVRRRLELKGSFQGAVVLDDYGHHPSEIVATLSAVRQFYPNGRLITIFQPHQYSRTRFFLDDFASSFTLAEEVLVPEIYFVRDSEASRRSVSGKDLVARLRQIGKKAYFLPTFEEVVAYLKKEIGFGDVVLTIGAGPVYKVADRLCNEENG